jgi:hypothetical protein
VTDNIVRDDGVVELRQCAFVKRNPFTQNLVIHVMTLPDHTLVRRFVALTTPDNKFYGDGVEVWVCESCATTLDDLYKATSPVPLGPTP